MRSKDESILQQNCVMWFRYQYSQYKKLLIAIPNGGSRNKAEAAKFKREGVTAGASDLILLIPSKTYPYMGIEMKTETGTQKDTQKEFQKSVESVGGLYVLIRSFDEFQKIIVSYMTNSIIIQ